MRNKRANRGPFAYGNCNCLKFYREFRLGATTALYLHDADTGAMSLWLVPATMRDQLAVRREFIEGVEVDSYAAACRTRFRAWKIETLAQAAEADDGGTPAFAQGRTVRGGPTTERLKFVRQTVRRAGGSIQIRTTFRHEVRGWTLHHELHWRRGASWFDSRSVVENTGSKPITLEMLASFSLGGITPFAGDDAPGRLRLHRFRSVWSMEGRLETRAFEDLQLERSWVGWGVRSERFGAMGAMPVSGFFPCAVVEDVAAGVCWGAQLVHPGPWQLEVFRRDDCAAFSGGLADREFGHWWKTLAPGESLTSPSARLACVAGSLDDCCAALTAAHVPALAAQPRSERALPIVFNEWMTTWGKPSHDNLVALARRLHGLGVKYLVIDAGWFAPANGNWSTAHGDWIASAALYPHGLRATADALRAEGLVPGLWFEMETCGPDSELWPRTELLLHRNGRPITVGARRFLDLRRAETGDYLAERVIGQLRAGGFGYLKVDYNDNLGVGADGAESPGEALRQHLEGVLAFFQRIRRELPDLVIENCSSGGHRLEPSLVGLTAMSSFSDAHECPELPIIAANLQRLMLPRQTQIWVALRQGESERRTYYSLAAGFLGRICFSGDFLAINEAQFTAVRRATALYRQAVPLIRDGLSTRHGPEVVAYRHAEGWQAVVRTHARQALVVAHTFGRAGRRPIAIPLPPGRWKLVGGLWQGDRPPTIARGELQWRHAGNWCGLVALLKR